MLYNKIKDIFSKKTYDYTDVDVSFKANNITINDVIADDFYTEISSDYISSEKYFYIVNRNYINVLFKIEKNDNVFHICKKNVNFNYNRKYEISKEIVKKKFLYFFNYEIVEEVKNYIDDIDEILNHFKNDNYTARWSGDADRYFFEKELYVIVFNKEILEEVSFEKVEELKELCLKQIKNKQKYKLNKL